MSRASSMSHRLIGAFVLLAMLLAGSLTTVALPTQAGAAVSEVVPRGEDVVTADALPTAQIDGVVWDQQIVGDTVFVGGSFSQARPAGAAAGTSQSPRSNLMSYTLSTGVMTSWNPGANAQVRTVTTSPDQSRVYVGGDFTAIGGASRSRIAAFNASNGQLISSFAPPVGYQVNDIVATASTVYVAGSFSSVGSQPRSNLAAFDAATGALLGWAPTAERQVRAIDITEDLKSVIIGGHFESINGAPVRGLAKVDAATGALQVWPVPISNAGDKAAVNSLQVQGGVVFGTSYHYGPGGNQEGPWQLDLATGDLIWVADCHGDNYDAFAGGSTVYTIGHPHYCGNLSMGFPQYSPWKYQHAMAWTKEATGTNIREVYGYANWDGRPSPSTVQWLPKMSIGSFTGAYQAGWTIEGNDQFVIVGGEFPRVNGTSQQGLVRFATASSAPNAQGPAFAGGAAIPTLQSVAPGAVKVGWLAGYDMDDRDLTYEVVRKPGGVVHTLTAASSWWDTPALSYVDTGLTPGSTYGYEIRTKDSKGNVVFGSTRSIQVPNTVQRNDYGKAVLADDPEIYWPLNETSGAGRIKDHAGGYEGVAGSAVSYGVSGALSGDTAISVDNNDAGRIYAEGVSHAPTEMSAEVWFRTTAASGRLLGFGDLQTGSSGHRDRQIYLADNGRVSFGVRAGGTKVVSSPQQYNDGVWHQAVATLTGGSARLYVDGVLVSQRHDLVEPEEYVGHWRLGGDNQSGWPSAGNNNFSGGIDEMSIYGYALTPQQVDAHYVASGRLSQVPVAPADDYGAAVFELQPDLYWRLAEASGTQAKDSGPLSNPGSYQGGHTKSQAGALQGVDNTAVGFDGSTGYVASSSAFTNPQQFSTEAWFKTTSTSGGKVIGFGSANTTLSSSYDRHTFMLNDGRLAFGVWTGKENRVTSVEPYNDGQWHHVVSSLSAEGMKLYVDGVQVGSNPNTGAQSYTGYWRAGGDRVWGGASSNFLDGTIDEVAVYSRPLTDAQTRSHYVLGTGTVTNTPPSAAFTHQSTDLQVAFDASSSSDDDGTIESFSWDFGDASFGSGPSPTHVYTAAGTYQVTLTVTDDKGASDAVTRSVTVSAAPANTPPEAVFETTVTDLQVSTDASGSTDSDGSIVAYSWDFGDGSSATGPSATHTYAAGGTYEITLTVTDDVGDNDTAVADVTVVAPPTNQAPRAAFTISPDALTVSVDGSDSSDTDGTIASYAWDFGDGSTATGSTASHTYSQAGTYDVTLSVTDDDGARGSTTQQVSVTAPAVNAPPAAAFEVTTAGLSATFDSTGSSDSDGTIAGYRWDFGDGTSSQQANPTHTYATAGDYTVVLTVTDDDGATDSASRSVTVTAPPPANEPPTAAFTSSTEGLTVQLDASSSSDTDGTLASYSWDFGDGTGGNGVTVAHTYAEAGTYQVSLTVVDDGGATDRVTRGVTVATEPGAQTYVTDSFSRSVSNGFGEADLGGAWSTSNTASLLQVSGGTGRITLPNAGSGVTAELGAVSAQDVEATVDFAFDKPATSSIYGTLMVRRNGNDSYRLRSRAMPTGTMVLLTRTVNGSETVLSHTTLPWVYQPGEVIRMRMTAQGQGSTDLAGRIWRVGDAEPTDWQVMAQDSTAALQKAGSVALFAYLAGSSSNAPVVASVDNLHVGAIGQVAPANVAPVAAFTQQSDGLTLSVDGSSSSDKDGVVQTWAWTFGDSTSATGRTATHTYAEAGSYEVTLKVTDDDGATHAVTRTVTVSAPGANVAPTAAFDVTASDLSVSVDATGSTDTDGSIATYEWDFGDGTTGSGVTASHTYGAAGSYEVRLTVTDDAGAQDSATKQVTVSAPLPPGVLAADSFERAVISGFGTADVGGDWTSVGSKTPMSVADGAGRITMSRAGSGPRIYLGELSSADVDATVDVRLDKIPSGGDTYLTLAVRRTGSSEYRLKARLQPTATMLFLTQTVNGKETNLAYETLPGMTYQQGDVFRMRVRAVGSGTTTLTAKMWRVGSNEPTGWQLRGTDSSAALQTSGGVGVAAYLSANADNAPVVAAFDDLRVTSATE